MVTFTAGCFFGRMMRCLASFLVRACCRWRPHSNKTVFQHCIKLLDIAALLHLDLLTNRAKRDHQSSSERATLRKSILHRVLVA